MMTITCPKIFSKFQLLGVQITLCAKVSRPVVTLRTQSRMRICLSSSVAHTVCCPLPFLMQRLDVNTREKGKLCGVMDEVCQYTLKIGCEALQQGKQGRILSNPRARGNGGIEP